jgi:hypothetical protein
MYHVRFSVISTWLRALVSSETSNGKGNLANSFCLLFSIYIFYKSVKEAQIFINHHKDNSELIINTAQCGPLLNTVSSYQNNKQKLRIFLDGVETDGV